MPHHRPKYKDLWWEELPEEARKAAAVLGWDSKEKWDQSVDVPYRTKTFEQLTIAEKRAAIFLQIDLIKEKLDIYWSEADPETKKAALALDWTEHKWNDDWNLWDLEVDKKYWHELTDEEKAGAMHFGYTHHTWDEDLVEVFEGGDEKSAEQKVGGSKEEKVEPEKLKEESQPEQKKFNVTRLFGGQGGIAFDHSAVDKGKCRQIKQITVYSGRKNVDGISIKYEGDVTIKNGGGSGAGDSIELADGEFINKVTVVADDEVRCLTFYTNQGNQLGPCGGKGGLFSKGGDESAVCAPKNMQLCGIKGKAGARLDAIGFWWGLGESA